MLGIICALADEFNTMISHLKSAKHVKCFSFDIYTGKIGTTEVAIILSGVGKVNSSIGACILIEHFSVKLLLSIGLAGAINPELMIGDLVVGDQLLYYDSYLPDMLKKYFETEIASHMSVPFTIDESTSRYVIDLLREELLVLPNTIKKRSYSEYPRVWKGLMVSGDMPLDSKSSADKIYRSLNPLSVDMESTSICHVSYRYNIKAVPIRIISDYANEYSTIYLLRYSKDLCNYLAELVSKVIENGLYQLVITHI